VLVRGETGVGKELVARAIHEESDRADGPLVAVDCGALPENLIESELFGYERGAFSGADRKKPGQVHLAEGGTLFLDEIGNLPLAMQAKLLRIMQERKILPLGGTTPQAVDVRFVAATNSALETLAPDRFRRDLFFRLAEFTIVVPPLRERREDIASLARFFREEASLELRRPVSSIEPEAMDLLMHHDWPGNVRELRNVIRQALVLTSDFTIRASDVRPLLGRAAEAGPQDAPATPGATDAPSLREIAEAAAEAAEKKAIAGALRSAGGNKTHAARLLRVDYKTLHVKMKRYRMGGSADAS
jgi:two-component system nitrogen regulation response regulator GlnG